VNRNHRKVGLPNTNRSHSNQLEGSQMLKHKDILIVGGYGIVGRQIAAELALDYANRVIVAGHSREKADEAAAMIGSGVRGQRIDVDDPSSIEAVLDDVGVIVSCVDQRAWLKQKYAGLDWYGLVVEVHGARGLVRTSLVGRGQARGTAIGAALLARALLEEEVKCAGIWLAEQVVPSEPFFRRLAAHGLVPTVEEQLHPVI
jgi:saccharopine dehydrogenase-like NADP-dependent oxidoreductase